MQREVVMTMLGLILIIAAAASTIWLLWPQFEEYMHRFAELMALSEEEALVWVSRRVALRCGVPVEDVLPSQPLSEAHVQQILRRIQHDFGIDLRESLAVRPTVQDVARALAIMSQSRLGKANTAPPPST